MYVLQRLHTLSSSLNLILLNLLFATAYSEVRLTQQSPLGLPCSGEEVVLQCTLQGTAVIWNFPGGDETLIPSSSEQVTGNFRTRPVDTVNGNFTSTLTFPAENGTVITCLNALLSRNTSLTVTVQGPPSVPSLSCAGLSEDVSGTVNVTVNWTLSGGDSADFYLINITTNAPQTPYGGLLNITTGSVTQHELTGFMTGYEYNITVRGVSENCGSLVGRESEPLTITPQVPAVPPSCNVTLSYNQSSRRLLFINSTWNTVPDPVDPGETCPRSSGDITHYQLYFQTGSVVATDSVNITSCTAGRCSHTFELPSNPPSSYDSVSVAAENVVGVGAARVCISQPISTNNNLLTGKVIDLSSPSDTRLNCTFLPFFTGSAHCTVQYGTDPTYMNLPYSAESTETGTAGDSVSVVLREQLNSSTVYYYTVSAVSGDVTVLEKGSFTTPLYNCSLMELWDLPAAGVTLLSDTTLLGDAAAQYPSCDDGSVGSVVLENITLNTATVAYYTGTTPGSSACFVCDEGNGYVPNTPTTAERFCQHNAMWSGSPVVCVPVPQTTTGAVVGIAVGGTIALIVGVLAGVLLFYCITKYRSKSKTSSHKQQAGPVYEEVRTTNGKKIELKENVAYGPVKQDQKFIELKANEAYGHVQH